MTNEDLNTPPSTGPGRGVRVGRATAWFVAGALGATALTGVALATTVNAQDENQDGQEQAEGDGPRGHRGPGGPGGHKGHGGPGGPGGPMLHSEGVIETPEGEYKDVVSQRGSVTEVNDNSITVASEDGYTANYSVNDDTKIHKSRSEATISDIAVGDEVRVMAEKNGDDVAAKHIGAMTAEEAAEAEKRREEMRQEMEERRAERENNQNNGDGETQDSGFTGGPRFGVQNA